MPLATGTRTSHVSRSAGAACRYLSGSGKKIIAVNRVFLPVVPIAEIEMIGTRRPSAVKLTA
jgi:hypothetical protein